MPLTVFVAESKRVIIQKLGDFSLADFANLILIEAKTHANLNFQKYFLAVLWNLFESTLLVLSHNYFVGNLSSKNIFLARNKDKLIVKFSNLVDFSFDYSQIANPHYATFSAKKPT